MYKISIKSNFYWGTNGSMDYLTKTYSYLISYLAQKRFTEHAVLTMHDFGRWKHILSAWV